MCCFLRIVCKMISFVKEYISTGIIYCFTSLRKRGVNIKAILSLNLIKAYISDFLGIL